MILKVRHLPKYLSINHLAGSFELVRVDFIMSFHRYARQRAVQHKPVGIGENLQQRCHHTPMHTQDKLHATLTCGAHIFCWKFVYIEHNRQAPIHNRQTSIQELSALLCPGKALDKGYLRHQEASCRLRCRSSSTGYSETSPHDRSMYQTRRPTHTRSTDYRRENPCPEDRRNLHRGRWLAVPSVYTFSANVAVTTLVWSFPTSVARSSKKRASIEHSTRPRLYPTTPSSRSGSEHGTASDHNMDAGSGWTCAARRGQ